MPTRSERARAPEEIVHTAASIESIVETWAAEMLTHSDLSGATAAYNHVRTALVELKRRLVAVAPTAREPIAAPVAAVWPTPHASED